MLDHLVYAAPNLAQAIDDIGARLGVRPSPGGEHVGGLTHNALLSLGEGSYLEIIAPVAGVKETLEGSLPFGLGSLTEPRLVTWAIAVDDIERRVKAARAAGYDPGNVVSGGRELPEGGRLEWRLALRQQAVGGGVVPFLIQWISGLHPAQTAPKGCELVGLRAEHPRPNEVLSVLKALDLDLSVKAGTAPRLIATIGTPSGTVTLS